MWLERKAGEIKRRRKDGVGVGILVWRFSKRAKGSSEMRAESEGVAKDGCEKGRVMGLRSFWEGLGSKVASIGA